MKIPPKRTLGTIFLLILAVIIIAYSYSQRHPSTLTLSTSTNKFNLTFQIAENDQQKAADFLEKTNLPSKILSGVEFELDSTSSARLAYLLPTTARLKFSQDRLNLTGQTAAAISGGQFNLPPYNTLKIPNSTSVAIFAEDLTRLLERKYSLPADVKNWLTQSLESANGQYFLIFGQNLDTALIAKPLSKFDFSSLSQNEIGQNSGLSYKQQTEDGLNFHLLKLSQADGQEITMTFFEMGTYLVLTSSLEAARELINTQKGQEATINFPDSSINSVSSAILIRPASVDNFQALSFFTDQSAKLQPYLAKVDKALFVVRDKDFSLTVDFSP